MPLFFVAQDGLHGGELWFYYPYSLAADATFDGKVNMIDFGTVANYWLLTNCGTCGGADSTGDGSVNFADVKVLCDAWLAGTQ